MSKPVNHSRDTQRGFTLVEVMVALFVVALALPALVVTISQYVDATGYMRDKSMAQMVAANKFEELRILSSAGQSLLRGSESGVATMAERDWYWRLESQPTQAENFYRVEITVAADEEEDAGNLYTLVAFLSADFRDAAGLGGEGG
ncbi:MAG: type II secretion system minor pseudopilin GspI [Pseudomonadota bacterium]